MLPTSTIDMPFLQIANLPTTSSATNYFIVNVDEDPDMLVFKQGRMDEPTRKCGKQVLGSFEVFSL
jgi:hypothetical protein